MKYKIHKRLGVLMPPLVVSAYKKNIIYAGMTDNPRQYATKKLFTSLKISLILTIISFFFFAWPIALIFLFGLFFGLQILFFVLVMLKADNRRKEIESMLPDALLLMSANVRAGMTIDKALWMSSRSEFGVLEEEFRRMASETLGGKSISNVFERMTNRVNSKIFKRASLLLVRGIELGGSLAKLLVEVSSDIRNSMLLQKEIDAATAMYTLFIVFASIFACPMLFAVSTFYVESSTDIWASQRQDMGPGAQTDISSMNIAESQIDINIVKYFATAAIFITTFFGALTIGLIQTGNVKTGIRYLPFFVIGGLLIYFLVYIGISSAFGGILTV